MSLIYNGTTITAVIYNGTNLQSLVHNGTTVFNAGPTMGCFYGGYWGTAYSNRCTRINVSGTAVGSDTFVGTTRAYAGGAEIGTTAVFYGGYYYNGSTAYQYNRATRINTSGTIIGAETNIGTARYYVGGAGVSTTAIFYGGWLLGSSRTNKVTRVNSSGALIGAETSVGATRYLYGDGAGIANNTGVFWGGGTDVNTEISTCTRINTSGTIIGSETAVYAARYYNGGAGVGSTAIFYTMATGVPDGYVTAFTNYNACVRINTSGTIIGSATAIGTARRKAGGGAASSTTAVFYGGYSTAYTNLVTRINTSGTIVGSQTNVGTSNAYTGGCGI